MEFRQCDELQGRAPVCGPAKWFTAFDLDKLTAGARKCFERIGSDTIQRVNAEFATRREQFKKVKLRWRVSHGARRSLGWVPFKAVQLKRKGKSLRFSGKAFRVFERELLEGVTGNRGCFAQDAVGDWWLCVPVARRSLAAVAPKEEVGLDLGLEGHRHHQRWGEAAGGSFLPKYRAEDCQCAAPRS